MQALTTPLDPEAQAPFGTLSQRPTSHSFLLLFFATNFVLLSFLYLLIVNSKRNRWCEDQDDLYEKIGEPASE